MVELETHTEVHNDVGVKPIAADASKAKADNEGRLVSGLAAYLAKLGLEDGDLNKVIDLLQGTTRLDTLQESPEQRALEEIRVENPVDGVGQSKFAGAGRRSEVPPQKTIRLLLAEEQQILRNAYQSVFSHESGIEFLGSWADTSAEYLVEMAVGLKPDVIVLGVKAVQSETVEMLELLRKACPQVGLVLLFAYYDIQGIKALRAFSRGSSAGCAYLLKHTIDSVEQLTQVIHSVAEERIIVDPVVMEELIRTGDSQGSFMQELSPKEMEVLSWLAKGYRNDSIAELLSRDVKTIERHINNIYSKLQNDKKEGPDLSMHPRVRAALTYLRATGLLSALQCGQD